LIDEMRALAERIVRLLKTRDPLHERVHLNPAELLAFSLSGVAGESARRLLGRRGASKRAAGA